MDFWFSEKHTKDVKLSIRVDRQVYSGQSDLQRIDVFDTPGKIFASFARHALMLRREVERCAAYLNSY